MTIQANAKEQRLNINISLDLWPIYLDVWLSSGGLGFLFVSKRFYSVSIIIFFSSFNVAITSFLSISLTGSLSCGGSQF